MNYDEMPAGMEMDQLVAEEVMGLEVAHRGPTGIPSYDPPEGALFIMDTSDLLPLYSTSHSAAIKMLEKKAAKTRWRLARVDVDFQKVPVFTAHVASQTASADTFPLAICRVALKAAAIEGQRGLPSTIPG